MPVQEASGYCKRCNKQVMIRRKGTNHVLHLLLTLFTAGLWLLIWIPASIRIGGWRCVQCGAKTGRSLMH